MTLILAGKPESWADELRRADLESIKRGVEFDDSTAGIAMTKYSNGDVLYVVDTTSASRTVTIPAAADSAGQWHTVKRITGGGNSCTVATGGGNIDGSATLSLPSQYDSAVLASDGENWWRV